MEAPSPMKTIKVKNPRGVLRYPSDPNADFRAAELLDYLYEKNALEENFERLNSPAYPGWCVPKDCLQGPPGSREPTKTYRKDLAAIQEDFNSKTMPVYQRAWAVTTATQDRYLIATSGLVLCMGVLIYDPATKTAALAHIDKDQIDKDQKVTTVVDFVREAFPGNSPLEVHFYGGSGKRGMESLSRANLTGQLDALSHTTRSPRID